MDFLDRWFESGNVKKELLLPLINKIFDLLNQKKSVVWMFQSLLCRIIAYLDDIEKERLDHFLLQEKVIMQGACTLFTLIPYLNSSMQKKLFEKIITLRSERDILDKSLCLLGQRLPYFSPELLTLEAQAYGSSCL